MAPTRAYLKAVGLAAQAFLRTVSRVVGGEVLNDAIAFFQAFDGMEEGFRQRANAVAEHLRPDPEVDDDPEKFFERVIELDLSRLEPHIVGPHTPDLDRPISRAYHGWC